MLRNVAAAGLEEGGEDDGAADGAGVGDVARRGAVGAALVAARCLDLGEIAVVAVFVAERAAGSGRVERLQAVICGASPQGVCLKVRCVMQQQRQQAGRGGVSP